jgi:3'-phosphoadenosine 5'-phosphosulfate sulfotransferase (PAPS reductase)/FAD synthetase
LADKVKLTNKCCRLIKNSKTKNDVWFITGLMRAESVSRKKTKCVNDKLKTINPIVDWTQKQVDDFIKEANVKIPECYSWVKRTGCLGCPYSLGTKKKWELFASHYPQRFEHLKALGLYDFLSTYIWKEKSDLLSDPTSEKPNKENEKVL